MKAIVLAALLGLGVALAGSTGASAAGLGGGINGAAKSLSLVEQTRYYCRNVRVCTWRYHHRYCRYVRTCRHWY